MTLAAPHAHDEGNDTMNPAPSASMARVLLSRIDGRTFASAAAFDVVYRLQEAEVEYWPPYYDRHEAIEWAVRNGLLSVGDSGRVAVHLNGRPPSQVSGRRASKRRVGGAKVAKAASSPEAAAAPLIPA